MRKEMLSSEGREVWIDWVRIDCLLNYRMREGIYPFAD